MFRIVSFWLHLVPVHGILLLFHQLFPSNRETTLLPVSPFPFGHNGALQQPTLLLVLNTLPLGANGMPVYAQPTPQNEIWVAIYEKAFAKFKGCPPIDPVGNPDISKLHHWGSALDALVNLTNKKFSFTAAPLPQTAFSTK